jgi:hypothetical protein
VVAPSGDFTLYSSLILNSALGPAGSDFAGDKQASSTPIESAKEIVFMGHRSVAHPLATAVSTQNP